MLLIGRYSSHQIIGFELFLALLHLLQVVQAATPKGIFSKYNINTWCLNVFISDLKFSTLFEYFG